MLWNASLAKMFKFGYVETCTELHIKSLVRYPVSVPAHTVVWLFNQMGRNDQWQQQVTGAQSESWGNEPEHSLVVSCSLI